MQCMAQSVRSIATSRRVQRVAPWIIAFLFGVHLVWWFVARSEGLANVPSTYYLGLLTGVIPFVSGLFGLLYARRWDGLRSSVGRAIVFLSLGMMTWAVGNFIFAYYNLALNVEVPYPSLADASYFASLPLWASGLLNLAAVTGARYKLQKPFGKLLIVLIPAVCAALSYYVLIVVARQGIVLEGGAPLKTFFDIAYPVADLILLTITATMFTLSSAYLGGKLRLPIRLIFLAFLLNYAADFMFFFTTTRGTYFVGDWTEPLYASAFSLLGIGILLIRTNEAKDQTVAESTKE